MVAASGYETKPVSKNRSVHGRIKTTPSEGKRQRQEYTIKQRVPNYSTVRSLRILQRQVQQRTTDFTKYECNPHRLSILRPGKAKHT